MPQRFIVPTAAAGMTLFASLCLFNVHAQSPNQRDIYFAQGLNDYGLNDYAEMYLLRVLRNRPQDPDGLNAQLAETYMFQNDKDKMNKALELVGKLKPGSRAQMAGKGSLGIYYYLTRDFKKSIAELEPVFDYVVKEAARTKNGSIFEDFKRQNNCLVAAYRELGQVAKATECVQRIQEALNPDIDPRVKTVTEGIFLLDGLDKMKAREASVEALIIAACNNASPEVKTQLKPLIDSKKKSDADYVAALKTSNAGNINTQKNNRAKVYGDIRKLIGVSEKDMTDYMNVEEFKLTRPVRLAMFRRKGSLAGPELALYKKFNTADWQDIIFKIVEENEGLMWKKQDSLAAMGVVLSARAYYYLGDYLRGADLLKKFTTLFDALDEAYKKDGVVEESPGSDAKYWEGMCALAAAKEAEKTNKAPDAFKNYVRAFVNFGRLGKNYPKYKDIYKGYQYFNEAADKVAELNPKMADKVADEKKKFKEPEFKGDAAAEVEKLCSPVVEQDFNSRRYDAVIKALKPILAEKRTSTGIPEVLNKLIISYSATGRSFEAYALAEYMAEKFPLDNYTKVALICAGNAVWDEAKTMEQKKSSADAVSDRKDEAIGFYNLYMLSDKSDPNAAIVATKIAREYLNRAVREGEELNKIPASMSEKRLEKKKEWLTAYDRMIDAYSFIITNFTNEPKSMIEAFRMSATAYTVTERHAEAAKVLREFIKYGAPHDAAALLEARYLLAERLYSDASTIRAEADATLNTALASMNEPVKPVEPVPPKKPEAKDASAPVESTPQASPAASGTETSVAEKPEKTDPMAEYEKAMKDFETKEADYKKAVEQYELALKEYNAKVESMRADAASAPLANYKEAIELLASIRREWTVEKVRTLPNEQRKDASKMLLKSDVESILAKVDALYPWLYDSCGMKREAIRELENFLSKSQDKTRNPSYQMRLGLIWLDMAQEYDKAGKTAEAADANRNAERALARVREAYPESPEAKNSDYYLAVALLGRKTYDKAISKLSEILADPKLRGNLSIGNERSLLSKLKSAEIPSALVADAAKVRLSIAEILISALSAPNVNDWVSPERVAELKADPKRWESMSRTLEEGLNFDAGNAALESGEYQKAVSFFDRITQLNDNSYYYNDLRFGRAAANTAMKKYDAARKDYGEIAARASQYKNYPVSYKAQVMAGNTYLEEKNYDQAFALFYIVSAPAFLDESWNIKPGDPYSEYIEEAIYKTAYTASLLGAKNDAEKREMIEKYKKNFIKGKYSVDINNLPAPASK